MRTITTALPAPGSEMAIALFPRRGHKVPSTSPLQDILLAEDGWKFPRLLDHREVPAHLGPIERHPEEEPERKVRRFKELRRRAVPKLLAERLLLLFRLAHRWAPSVRLISAPMEPSPDFIIRY